jgi:hypothetical protein
MTLLQLLILFGLIFFSWWRLAFSHQSKKSPITIQSQVDV